jgi:hypothetical protein
VPGSVSLLAGLAQRGTEAVFVSSGALAAELGPYLPGNIALEVSDELSGDIAAITEEALDRTVSLEGGGRLIFDEGAALTAIDVDLGTTGGQSGKGAGDSLRRRVLDELGRLLGLRGIGGQVVLDLPRSAVKAPKVLRDGLTAALKPHGLVSIPAVTKEGLVVLIMGQNRPSLLSALTEEDGGAPRPGRRFVPHVEAWRAFDGMQREARRPSEPLALSPAAADAWRAANADERMVALKGWTPDILAIDPASRGKAR